MTTKPADASDTPRTDAVIDDCGGDDYAEVGELRHLAYTLERSNGELLAALKIADEALVWKHMPDGAIVQEHSADNITHPDCNRCKAAAVVRAAIDTAEGRAK